MRSFNKSNSNGLLAHVCIKASLHDQIKAAWLILPCSFNLVIHNSFLCRHGQTVHNEWTNSITGRHLFNMQPSVNSAFWENRNIRRRFSSVLCHLRSGHCQLNFCLHRFSVHDYIRCLCDTKELLNISYFIAQ